jgi:hypothetical protein
VDYFEVLGVDKDASDEEIAAAYRERAKRLHPDQHPNASPAEQAKWSAAMAQLNEAWDALRDRPALPATSDLTTAPAPAAATPPAAPPPRTAATRRSAAVPVAMPHIGRWVLASLAALLAVIAIVALVIGATGSAAPPATTINPTPVWGVGTCVAGSPQIRPVACSEPHNGKVIARSAVPTTCPDAADSYAEDTTGVWCIDSSQ